MNIRFSEIVQSPALKFKYFRKHIPTPKKSTIFIVVIICITSGFIWESSKLWRFFVYLFFFYQSLNYLYKLVWAADFFTSAKVGVGLVASVIILPFPIAIIAVQFGWISIIPLVLVFLVVLVDVAIMGRKIQYEMNNIQNVNYPYGSENKWILAVSRRFTSPIVEEIYQNEIKPLLSKHGVIIECLYAGDESSDADFWLNRMRMIFELADFHILLEHDMSSAVYIEHYLSVRYATASMQSPQMLRAIFNEDNPILQARVMPSVIVITPNLMKPTYRLNRRAAIVPFSGDLDKRREELGALDDAILKLKKRRILDMNTEISQRLGWGLEWAYDISERESLQDAVKK